MFASMTIEYGKETLTSYAVKVDNERMGIFHSTTCTHVFGNTYTKCWMICRVTIENLYYISYMRKIIKATYTMGIQVCCCDRFRARV